AEITLPTVQEQRGGVVEAGRGALVVASVAAAPEGIDPLLPRALAQVLGRAPAGGEQLAGRRDGDVRTDARRQQQAQHEQLPQGCRLVPQRDRRVGRERAAVRPQESMCEVPLSGHGEESREGPGTPT